MRTKHTEMLAAAFLVALRDFSDLELASLNNAMSLYNRVPAENQAHKRALDRSLIKPSGDATDVESLLAALSVEILSRESFQDILGAVEAYKKGATNARPTR